MSLVDANMEKAEGWNRPQEIEPDGGNDLLIFFRPCKGTLFRRRG